MRRADMGNKIDEKSQKSRKEAGEKKLEKEDSR